MRKTRIALVSASLAMLIGLCFFAPAHFPRNFNDPHLGRAIPDSPVFPIRPEAPASSVSKDRSDARDNHLARRDYRRLRLADPLTGRIPRDIHRLEQEFSARLPRRGEGNSRDKAVSNWTARGPWNVGGRTRALGIDVGDPTYRTLLAGGVSGGMWRSTDDGATWNLTTGSSQTHSVTTVAQDTRSGHQNVWYYGTGEADGPSVAWPTGEYWHNGDGIFKSTDSGASWTLLPATSGHDIQNPVSPWQFVHRIVSDPSNSGNDVVYAATWGFIFRSVDGGDSFTPVLGDPNTLASYTDVAITSMGILYATMSFDGGQHGAFRSVDGINWTDITPGGYADYDRIILAIAPSNENIVWFQVSNSLNTPDAALLRYQYLFGDGSGAGGSWANRSDHLGGLPWNGGSAFFDNQDNYCQMVAVHPNDPETVFLGGVNLYRGSGGFSTFGDIDWIGGWLYGNHHADQHRLVFQPGSNAVAYTGSDGGVHKTTNAQAPTVAWESLNNGYNTCQFYTAAIDENLPGSPVVIGGMQDNGTWFSGLDLPAHPWTEILPGDGGFCAVADASGGTGTYYMSYQENFGIFRYTLDNETGSTLTWSRVDPGGGNTSLWLKPYILDPNDTRMMYLAAGENVWRNSDLTAIPDFNPGTANINWSTLTAGAAGVPVTALAMSRSTDRVLYFGNMNGQVYRLSNAHSAPAGSAAVRLDVGAGFPAGGYVSSIAIHPDDDQQVLVAFSNYNVVNLFYSADGGASWTDVEGNLGGANSPSVRSVAFMPDLAGDVYFVGTSTGLYSSSLLAGAATVWQMEAAEEIGNVVVDMVTVRPADKLVVAGTHGKGMFRGYLGTSDVPGGDLAHRVRLRQNVPNPFNPSTEISFELTEGGAVALRIFDVSGRLVKTLLEGHRPTGGHTLTWRGDDDNGRAVGSGMYIYRLDSGGEIQTRTMTLVR